MKDTVIFGISPDSEDSHRRFRAKQSLPFDLLLDPDLRICRLYRVKVTNLLVFNLIERVTYVIGKDGRILRAVSRTEPAGHASAALCAL